MAQQTAVEWLLKNLPKSAKIKLTDEGIKEYLKVREQAKAMEKERMIEGYANGHNDGCRYMNNEKQQFEHGEQYYEQTYGGGEQ